MKNNNVTRENLNRKFIKNLAILILCGFVLASVDILISNGSDGVPFIASDKGVYIVRPDKESDSRSIILEAEVGTGKNKIRRDVTVTLEPYSEKNSEDESHNSNNSANAEEKNSEELISYEIRSVATSANDDRSRRKIILPSHLSSGESVVWTVKKTTNTSSICLFLLIISILLYTNRLGPLKRIQTAQQDSITRQLPEFINRLVLLLNAGLVLSSAFEKSVEGGSTPETQEDYFYCEMNEIYKKIKQTNGSINYEFREFAKSKRNLNADTAKELMRISNIFNDNISRGVELTDKLQSESEILWLNRKRNCEERGRIAETRLTIPLTLFLLVLITITVAPALLEL